MYDLEVKMRGQQSNELSIRAYNIAIGLILLWGFVINIIMCACCTEIFMQWNPVAIIIGYFVIAIAGIFLSESSRNAFVSFIGYNMVVVPVGVVLSIFLTDYDQISVMNALITTVAITLLMILLGSIFPQIFLSMGRVLFVCLTGVVICELIFLLIGFSTPSIWDWIVALIFCGYIGYDWAEAQTKPRTLDNAVDSVVALYLDIVNLFIRLLSASDDD